MTSNQPATLKENFDNFARNCKKSSVKHLPEKPVLLDFMNILLDFMNILLDFIYNILSKIVLILIILIT